MLYYNICMVVSALLSLVYLVRWHKHFHVTFTLMSVIIPISIYATGLLGSSQTAHEALNSIKLCYIGGCFLPLLIFVCILFLCQIKLNRSVILGFASVNMMIYTSIVTTEYTGIFYKSVDIQFINGICVPIKEYGPMHTVFYVMLFGYGAASLGVLIYSLIKKKQVSCKVTTLMLICELFTILVYALGKFLPIYYELTPIGYCASQILFLLTNDRICLYDTDGAIIESHSRNSGLGYFSFDFKMNYLGCNAVIKKIFPELAEFSIDKKLTKDNELFCTIYEWVEECRNSKESIEHTVERGDSIYKITVGYLFDGNHIEGYQFVAEDNTREQKYISLINNYNRDLENEVEKKTAHINEMQDKMVLGLADIVENRDNSTGGHIKRTSQVVKILMDEIMNEGVMNFDRKFYECIIKAAPMHDLGKIAVDDEILRKPGKYTAEEYEIMKIHASKGAEIVHQVLDGIDDPEFMRIAENVAHYHHERIDGSGYPEKLKGDEIPVEARIMAIADVYDALVSKRCYKDEMSFEEASGIIEDGMGKHFDPAFNECFEKCRPHLEEYYSSLQKQSC